MSCALCGNNCNGTLMRTDPRYNRIRTMLTAPEVPRLSNGGIGLCHRCQRDVYWRGGFIALLASKVKRAAHYAQCRQRADAYHARRVAA